MDDFMIYTLVVGVCYGSLGLVAVAVTVRGRFKRKVSLKR